MSAAPPKPDRPKLAPTLRNVHVGLREDLETSRHLFRGIPSYVVRDPLTFQSQQLSLANYQVFVAIDAEHSLSSVFERLIEQGKLSREDEESFYQFVLSLHRLGFLRLPFSDDKLLYRRFQAKAKTRRREKLWSFLFLRIPVWNPSAFLNRTIHLARPLFGRAAFVFWLLLIATAGIVAAQHWNELIHPTEGILVARNLPLIWITLIVLKVFHEFGHAYACRHYGGHVPEMGVFLIVFTPCAYVDASACWGFTRRRERLIVCLAGMYIESFFAAIAVLVWAATDPSLFRSLAYNVIFLAGTVTVLFNINPLMRFDGYYIASDLWEIPNLRQRSSRYLLGVFKRLLLGVPLAVEEGGRRLHGILLSYGIAVTFYRMGLLIAIAALLVMKLQVAGFVAATMMLGSTVFSSLRRLTTYLWHAEETARIRRRAVALSLMTLSVIPAGLLMVPVPSSIKASGVIGTERKTVVRAQTGGFLVSAPLSPGDRIEGGGSLAELANDGVLEAIAIAQANVRAAEIRIDAYRVRDPIRQMQEEARARGYAGSLALAESRQADLSLTAPHGGRVIDCVREAQIGAYVEPGTPLATIIDGRWQVRAVLTAEELAQVRPRPGQAVEFRAKGSPERVYHGVIARVAPAGSRNLDLTTLRGLTHLGGGDIAVDPATGEASRPFFEVVIDLREEEPADVLDGMTALVRFDGDSEPVGTRLGRRLARFWNRMLRG